MATPSTHEMVANLADQVEHRFYAKYRATVVDNVDPLRIGRLTMRVPNLLGKEVVTGWAMPCVPYGGAANQGLLFIPDIGGGVWAEFEGGELQWPIWSGTWWSNPANESGLPKPNAADGAEDGSVQDPPTRKIIKTAKGHTLQFEDADGKELVTLVEAEHKHVITLDSDGIKVTDGKSGHVITLDATGIAIKDGVSSGNEVVMDSGGVTISDANGNKVVLASAGVQIGKAGATESLVHGTTLAMNVATFIMSLSTHTHVGNLGAPTSPPVAPMKLDVPLSKRHTTE
jgi:hypothetical protein